MVKKFGSHHMTCYIQTILYQGVLLRPEIFYYLIYGNFFKIKGRGEEVDWSFSELSPEQIVKLVR